MRIRTGASSKWTENLGRKGSGVGGGGPAETRASRKKRKRTSFVCGETRVLIAKEKETSLDKKRIHGQICQWERSVRYSPGWGLEGKLHNCIRRSKVIEEEGGLLDTARKHYAFGGALAGGRILFAPRNGRENQKGLE